MIRSLLCLVAVSLFAIQPAVADEAKDSNFADYTVLVGGSPFGYSFTFAANQSRKTSYNFSIGGLPGLEMEQEIGGNDYDTEASSSWMGAFITHRPIDGAEWFRLQAGIGLGQIENVLTYEDDMGETQEITANYTENPVAYMGIGFGADTSKGFQWAVDIGLLQTAGPVVDGGSEARRKDVEDFWMYGNILPNFQINLGYGF